MKGQLDLGIKTLSRFITAIAVISLGFAVIAPIAIAQDKGTVAKYREMIEDEDGNPAALYADEGEIIWKKPNGPKNVSLEKCDLGLGAGKLDGAYAQMPRYFKDTKKVMDVEGRVVHCMKTLQGIDEAVATKNWYSNQNPSDLMKIVTYIGSKSNGRKINVSTKDPEIKKMYDKGEYMFYRRSGEQDFSCAICHNTPDVRIRLQELASLSTKEGAAVAMHNWPSYRNSQSAVWTMERRLIDCMRQQRIPEPAFLSESIVALQVYLQVNANGTTMKTPGIKR